MNNWLARGILFLVVGLGGILCLSYSTSHFKSDRQIILLNTTRPDFSKLLGLDQQEGASFSKTSLDEYFRYFHLVTQSMPDNRDGTLILGYLYAITGDNNQAQVFLKKAYLLDPSFFFTEYDLGLLWFEQGDYTHSADILKNALTIPPEQVLRQMTDSIIYRQFFSSMKDDHAILIDLQQAYHDAYVLLIEVKQKESQGENLGPHVHAHIM